jgi:hypothetical protein
MMAVSSKDGTFGKSPLTVTLLPLATPGSTGPVGGPAEAISP